MEGVDYAFSSPSPAGLAQAGKQFAMRYVGPGSDPKHLTVAEAMALNKAGLSCVTLVEGAVGDPKFGFNVGVSHASSALAMCRARGFPTNVPMYFAVDYDVSSTSWPAAREYLRGAGTVIGPSLVGIYGEYDAMVWAKRDGVAAWFFQTYAWSGGKWYPGNHVEQYRNGVSMAGGTVDLCRSKQADFGQWSMTTQKGSVMAVIVRWPAEVSGKLYFSNGSGMHHIPGTLELGQIQRGWPGIQTVDATKWPANVVHQLYGPEGAPWGAPPEPTPPSDEAAVVVIATRVARETVAATTLVPPGKTSEAVASVK